MNLHLDVDAILEMVDPAKLRAPKSQQTSKRMESSTTKGKRRTTPAKILDYDIKIADLCCKHNILPTAFIRQKTGFIYGSKKAAESKRIRRYFIIVVVLTNSRQSVILSMVFWIFSHACKKSSSVGGSGMTWICIMSLAVHDPDISRRESGSDGLLCRTRTTRLESSQF